MSDLIFVEQSPEQGKRRQLASGTTIGREDCDITIADPEISRRQMRIDVEADGAVIEDLGSTNGTFVNDERISGRRRLESGDRVRFGGTVWVLQPAPQATRVAQDVVIADPQATRARAIPQAPARPEPSTEATPAAAPAAAAPAQALATANRRGDVPAPDFQPSTIRRVVPPPGAPAPFGGGGAGQRRGSAATRLSATIFATIVVALTAAGVVLYYITEPFK